MLLLGGIAWVDADESESGEVSGAVRPRVLDPPAEADGQFTVVRAQGEIAAIAHDRFDDEPARLGGHLRDTDGWRPLAEADVVRRRKATVVATDHGVLVWGGERLRAPIEQAERHPDGPWPLRSDGAWLDFDP